MAIHRAVKDTNFTVMSNFHLRDRHLSLKTKGLMSQILALHPDWKFSVAGLAAINREGKNAIRSALMELEQYGYLCRRRLTDAAGKFVGYEYTIWEIPDPRPTSDYPTTENRTELNTEDIKDQWGDEEWI
jgi:hypothetical protein